ncbi:MAG: SPOR domain-containing protein [Oligoflexia bacterium]|nr:SPOR domain-containing protein [Oligoflexia bacterium]
MNKKNMQQWELRLGVAQTVVLLGVVTGSIACAFYVGFSSGRRVGFEAALERTMAHTARFPVAGTTETDSEDTGGADVLARLSTKEVSETATEQLQPVLGAIKSAELAPLGAKDEESGATSEKNSFAASAKAQEQKNGTQLTLGDVFDSQEPVAKAKSDTSNAVSALVEETAPKSVEKAASKPELKAAENSAPIQVSRREEKPISSKTANVEAKTAVQSNATTQTTVSTVNSKKAPQQTAEVRKSVEAKNATPAKEPSMIREVLPPGWFAQVAAPKKMADATSIANKLKSSGFPVMIEVARVRGEEYFRVIVGPETNKQQADRLVGQLKRESYLQGEPFLRVVKNG